MLVHVLVVLRVRVDDVEQGCGRAGIDTDAIAYLMTDGTSAAAIEETVAEAWMIAVSRSLRAGERPEISERDLITAWERRSIGRTSALSRMTVDELYPRALHEVGHAVTALAYGLKLAIISIEPQKGSFGCVFATEDGGLLAEPVERTLSRARVFFGGPLAEQACGLEQSVLAGTDILGASAIIVELVDMRVLGDKAALISPLGAASARGNGRPPHSQNLTEVNDAIIEQLLGLLYQDVENTLARLDDTVGVEYVARTLAAERTMTGASFTKLASEIFGDLTQFAVRDEKLNAHRTLARYQQQSGRKTGF
jgi:ATP-dependent Zn protease